MTELVPVNRPLVAAPAQRKSLIPAAGTLAMIGLGVFFWLSEARAAHEQDDQALPPLAASASAAAPVTPAVAPPSAPVAAASPGFFVPKSGPVTLVANNPAPGAPIALRSAPVAAPDRMAERLHAPALVVDLAQANVPAAPGSVAVRTDSGIDDRGRSQSTTVAVPAPGAGNSANANSLSDTERFSARVGNEEVEVATAHRMTGLDRLVPQGAVIGAVMETALNSDLPGYARAMVQRDVYSFDGSAVLIPAGSRLIGQYKSGIAQGASRLFVLWSRLIRPDGVSIELASPATDDLGRGGLGGKVNRHFLQRFGGAILTSVLSGGISAATASLAGGSTILVGNAGQASSLASQATQSADIPPTITTRQGASVRIFVARDLDFSRVGPSR